LKKYKSPSSNQILAELIQAGGEILLSAIHKLFNSIWNKEDLHDQWKESIIVPVHKKGDKTGCNNYRGISLLSQFKYLGTTVTNQNLIQEEIKRRLSSGNVCFHSIQNLLSSRLLSKNLKIRVYKTIILLVLCWCETWSLTLKEEHRLRVLEQGAEEYIWTEEG
jgi:hypothetical protein